MDRGIEKTYLNWDPEIDPYAYDDLIYDNGISTQLAQTNYFVNNAGTTG